MSKEVIYHAQVWLTKPTKSGIGNIIRFFPIEEILKLPEGWSIHQLYRNAILIKHEELGMIQASFEDSNRERKRLP